MGIHLTELQYYGKSIYEQELIQGELIVCFKQIIIQQLLIKFLSAAFLTNMNFHSSTPRHII